MKRLLIALTCLILTLPCLAQNANEPASKDDIILYLRTMHTHDLMRKTMEVQSQTMRQLFREQIQKEKGSIPPDFDEHFKKMMDDLIKGMPADEITQAMIPAYQKHFTKGDIDAMNAFYSSPVGQKVLAELPAVMQEGNQAALPILSKYLSEWEERLKNEFDKKPQAAPGTAGDKAPAMKN
jgi:hypothetical protein